MISRSALTLSVLVLAPFCAEPLRGQALPKPQEAKKAEAKLRELRGPIVFSEPLRRKPVMMQKVGRVNIDATIDAVQGVGAKTFVFHVGHADSDLTDFELFLEAAQKSGIDVWLKIDLPASGWTSVPHQGNYAKWCQSCVKLAKRYPRLKALVFEGFNSPRNKRYFPGFRYSDWSKILHEAGVQCIGLTHAVVQSDAATFKDGLDAWIVCSDNIRSVMSLAGLIEGAQSILSKSEPLMTAFYCSPTKWDKRAPEPGFAELCLRVSLRRTPLVVLRDLPLLRTDPVYRRLKKCFQELSR